VVSSLDTDPTKRPKRSLASNVSAVASAAPRQRQEAVEEPMVLDQIAGQYCIGQGSGEQFRDEAMSHRVRPVGLACCAQNFGEALRHDVSPCQARARTIQLAAGKTTP
jgi:hypothetical protein